MDIYEKVLRKLLIESTKLKKLPDPKVLKAPLNLVDNIGFTHQLVDTSGERYLVKGPEGKIEDYTYEQLIEKFEGE